ncbi:MULTISPECIES: phospholipase D-like domain-containing protein [unclassified Variovorax]|uniref:phospholipase D-like domain-containing protein n=1 Tax=unclassified Variovorax TaxID=663243 RepID=UPI00076C7239|nr:MULTISPECIES: phospholipase D-like domain-containing protein [unclassified Variovorax]KWT87784.1 Cardiolipin synthetase [Variovorax sp. WDL1]PNG59457.1 putative cardiolipin synthase YwiE [Variovorax sp. B4]PNG60752.1 putative cardiolipin synthase YwiE [Variovorax sp. B2]VTV13333.1 putative cardiolipin synthase YwiE [Variovorax sp. WDL1]
MGHDFLDWLRSGWALLALATLVVVLGLAIWSIRRHRDPRLVVECDASIADLLPSLSGLTQGTVYEGNAVELLENGAFFDVMFEEIANARASVHFETFLWKEGALGERLANALIERRRAGVKVRVLVDADGGKKMGRDAERLRSGDCNLRMHHPRHIRNIGVFNDRDHRKLLVVDGRVAMVGGHCIVDSWLGNGESREHVRDLGVRLRGPIVHAVQGAFSENWVEDTGELFVGDEVFPPLPRVGEIAIHVASLKPEGSPPAVKILHHLVPCIARKRIWIQNPYFLPDSEAIEALCDAAKRGVDVRVMVPSAEASDMPMVQHAAHRNFHLLLAGGVRIFEYSKCLLHQKAMTVDTAWCAIGSSNFDDRSFETNDEITLGLRDDALAAQLEAIFERDMQDCTELHGDAWARRGLRHRCKDNLVYAFNELL